MSDGIPLAHAVSTTSALRRVHASAPAFLERGQSRFDMDRPKLRQRLDAENRLKMKSHDAFVPLEGGTMNFDAGSVLEPLRQQVPDRHLSSIGGDSFGSVVLESAQLVLNLFLGGPRTQPDACTSRPRYTRG